MVDSFTEAHGEVVAPKDGDLSICLKCGYLTTFSKGRLIPLSQKRYGALDMGARAYLAQVESARRKVVG